MPTREPQNADGFLTGKLLIATPSMGDPRFEKTVILVCHHTPETAMGIVINKAIDGMTFRKLLKQLKIRMPAGEAGDAPVHFGGPVQTSRGFVLHSDDYSLDESTLSVTPGVSLTATMEVLKALGEEAGPEKALFALGYAGWGAGQLEAELQQNAWLIGEVEEDFIFDPDLGGKWLAALAMIGVDPAMMSDEMGRA